MPTLRQEGDLIVTGNASFASMTAPSNSIGDAQVTSGSPLGVTKVTHMVKAHEGFEFADVDTPTSKTRMIFVATSACTVRNFKGVLVDTGTSTSITFDLKKIPVGSTTAASILSAAVSFTHSDTDNTPKAGTISSASLAAGDMLIAVMTVTSSTGAKGPACWVEVAEVGT